MRSRSSLAVIACSLLIAPLSGCSGGGSVPPPNAPTPSITAFAPPSPMPSQTPSPSASAKATSTPTPSQAIPTPTASGNASLPPTTPTTTPTATPSSVNSSGVGPLSVLPTSITINSSSFYSSSSRQPVLVTIQDPGNPNGPYNGTSGNGGVTIGTQCNALVQFYGPYTGGDVTYGVAPAGPTSSGSCTLIFSDNYGDQAAVQITITTSAPSATPIASPVGTAPPSPLPSPTPTVTPTSAPSQSPSTSPSAMPTASTSPSPTTAPQLSESPASISIYCSYNTGFCSQSANSIVFSRNGSPDVVTVKSVQGGGINYSGNEAVCTPTNNVNGTNEQVSIVVNAPMPYASPGAGSASYAISSVLYNNAFTTFTASCTPTFGDNIGNTVQLPISVAVGG